MTTDLDEDLPEVAVRIGGKPVDEAARADAADVEDEAEETKKVVAEVVVDEESAGEESAAIAPPVQKVPAKAASAAEPLRVIPHGKKDERKQVMQELDAAVSRTEETPDYQLPPIDLLLASEPVSTDEHEKEVRRKAKVLEKTFANFGFNVKVVEIETGPVIAQFEVELEAGLRLSKITSLADDVAIALRVPSVRIVAPIPGKNTVGIEVPNAERQLVRLREVIEEANGKAAKMQIPIYLGKDVAGNPLVADLTEPAAPADRRPHRHGQERVPEHDHRVDAHDPPARRSADAADRPQDGRTEPLQDVAAPDASGRHRHAQGRSHPGLGRREDGRALLRCWPGPACGTSPATTSWAKKS